MQKYWPQRDALSHLSPDEMKSKCSKNVEEINSFLRENNFSIQLKPSKNPYAYFVASIMDILLHWSATGTETEIIVPKQFVQESEEMSITDWVDGAIAPFIDAAMKKYPSIDKFNARDFRYMARDWLERSMIIRYPAISITDSHGFKVVNVNNYPEPVVIVNAKNNDRVYMTIAKKPLAGFDLLNAVIDISSQTKTGTTMDCDEIKFPMVTLDDKPDISWLLELGKEALPTPQLTTVLNNHPEIPRPPIMVITEALQQTKFQMNEIGAAAQSAVALTFDLVGAAVDDQIPSRYTLDKPFYLWIERPGVNIPVFAAYIDEQDWKKPDHLGNLDTLFPDLDTLFWEQP